MLKKTLLAAFQSLLRSCRACWSPRAVGKPLPPCGLLQQSFLVRAVLVLHYWLLDLEYSISRGGKLREWARLNLLVGALLLVPALLVLPGLALLAAQLGAMASGLREALASAFWMTLYGGGAFAVWSGVGMLRRLFLGR